MKAKTSSLLLLWPWASVPLVLGLNLIYWRRLPEELAVHFDSSGAANGWLTRWQLVVVEAALLLFVLTRYTLRLAREENVRGWSLVSYYFAVCLMTGVFIFILISNL